MCIRDRYIIDVGTPYSIITDHGTQFKGRRWTLEMSNRGIKTYKTSIYHPSSNPAEKVLREVGRVLRTYCCDNHSKWSEFLHETETFLNIAHHETIGVTPYQMMFSKPPPREITNLIPFPEGPEEELDLTHVYSRLLHKMETRRKNKTLPIKILLNTTSEKKF